MTRFRVISLIVAIFCAITLFGCGSQSAVPTTPGASAASSSPQASASLPGDNPVSTVELTVARFDLPAGADSSDAFTGQGGQFYNAAWAELAQKFSVHITYRALDFAARDETVKQMIASGGAPDAMLATLPPAACKEYLSQGLIRALPAGFEANYANIKANLDMVLRRGAYQSGDAYFAIPRALEGAEPYTGVSLGFYYRKDIARPAGLETKDAYTLDELYALFERVQAENPNMTMYGHALPDSILELGIAEAAPETAVNGGFFQDAASGAAAYAYRQDNVTVGIKQFKQFYDAWFLDRDFYQRPAYEARARFANGALFAFTDAFGIPTLNALYKDFQAAHPDAKPEDAIGWAWLKDAGGALCAYETGNSWSEWVFGAALQDTALTRFLSIYDYLLSPEGLPLAAPGTASPVTPLIAGALEDSRVCALNPAYSDAAKQTVSTLIGMRKAASPRVIPFAQASDAWLLDNAEKTAELKPAKAIARIVCDTAASGVEAAWKQWLNENAVKIDEFISGMDAYR